MWFRRDLRLHDNPAWANAMRSGGPVLALYVLEERLLATAGPHRRRQFVAELAALDESIRRETGGCLHVRSGSAARIVPTLAGTDAVVYFNADVTPYAQERDAQITGALGARALATWGTLFHPPGSVLTGKGTLSKVFTPFYNVWKTTPVDNVWKTTPVNTVWKTTPVDTVWKATVLGEPGDVDLAELVTGSPPLPAGEFAARQRLDQWLRRVDQYKTDRDLPGIDGTSMLSSDLRFGTISPRYVADMVGDDTDGRRGFVRQLSWRDWWAHTLLGFPSLAEKAVRPEYDRIAWVNDSRDLAAWQNGQTGYPIVDAGMRQLNQTGWMHNRVRMIVASFLVKDLLVDWREGERYFRRLLIDADIAQNAGNWQWVAGTGPDAAPYFRVFNPVSQSRKFDAQGNYLRRWLPELASLDDSAIHAPWEVAPLDLAAAGVVLDDDYPAPIIDHGFARDRALATYKQAKDPK